MQSGVAFHQEADPSNKSPKHLRVGINSAHVSHAALARLLAAKGIITNDEYVEALIDQAKQEADGYERLLSEIYGREVKLGSLY